MNKPLIISDKDYSGMYVTTAHGSQKVISSSESPAEAYTEARDKGCEDPILIYVPDEELQVY